MKRSQLLSIVLIITVAVLLGGLSQRHDTVIDWTYGHRASLTPASQRVVAALADGPIVLTAFVAPGAERNHIRTQLARYTRASANVQLKFVDPALQPERVRTLGIKQAGAVRVTYQGRAEILHDLHEPEVTQALQRLSSGHAQWLVFVTGHGERSLAKTGPSGYSQLADALQAQGLQTRKLNLAQTSAIPDNAAALVIASPQSALLPGETAMLTQYVQDGGNLLWLRDPDNPNDLAALASALGIHWQTGTLIYPDYEKLGTGHPAMALVTKYPQTAVTSRIQELTLFPFAGAVTALDASSWQTEPFLRSARRSWLETQELKRGMLKFQPDQGDRAGPLTLGLLLTRPAANDTADKADTGDGAGTQRIAVIADSDFISNEFIDTLANRRLGLAVFQWLAHRDAQIAVDVTTAPDASLQLAPGTIRSLWYVFVILLPLSLLLIGIGRWWSRRRR